MLPTLRGPTDLNAFNFPGCGLHRVPGRFGGVLPPGRRGPADSPVGKLVDRPARVLLETMITPTLRAAVAQARPPARLVRRVVVEVALGGGPAAARSDARHVPDPGQVPELDPGIMALSLQPVVTFAGIDRVEPNQQIRSGSWDA